MGHKNCCVIRRGTADTPAVSIHPATPCSSTLRCGTPSSSPSIKAGRPANPAADRRVLRQGHVTPDDVTGWLDGPANIRPMTPAAPAGHLFRTLKSRSGWCSPTPQPAPAGCSASARRPASATPAPFTPDHPHRADSRTPTGSRANRASAPTEITVRIREPTGPCAFDSFLCRPGKEGAHEKGGGVEGEVGPVPAPAPDPGAAGGVAGDARRTPMR